MLNSQKLSKTKLITYTALMLAVLVAAQLITKSMGQYVTGSCVNFVLALTAFILGLVPSLIVAGVSPFMAFILGIGTPIIQIVPMIAIGNVTYVVIISLLTEKFSGHLKNALVILVASVMKFLVLFVGVTKVVLPSLGLPAQKVEILSASFSFPQLITALIGGLLVSQIVPQLKKNLR